MSFFDLPPIIERMLLLSDRISDLNFSVGQPPQIEINGKLTPVQPLGMQKLTPYQNEIIAMTLLHGNPDAAVRLAQTGTTDLSYSLPSRARFRVNIFQQRGVYSIVMRVIPTDIPTLKSLNLPQQLEEIANLKNGLVLITGPTGSGKSSTLAAIIDLINEKKHYHVVTIEDPIEYQLQGITQIPVNEKKGLTFARGLRSLLRHDPDKIMIGEIRDQETAQIAIQSALTGHLVFTTVHANNVIDVIGRFLNMGVEPYNFVSSLNCVLAQRLVRLICPACKRPHRPSSEDLIQSGLGTDEYRDRIYYESSGCLHCNHTGYRGRTAIHELLGLTDNIRDLIVERRPSSEIRRAAQAEGLSSLRASALEKLMAGVTSLREINRVTFAEGKSDKEPRG